MKKIFSFFTFLLLVGFVANAQVTSSKITGTVTDDKGEPLFGANIVVLHGPTGTKSGTIAQENGRYIVPNLRVGGPYTITISYVGYSTQEVKNVMLTLGKTTNVSVTLTEEGTTLDEIVVSSSRSSTFNNDRTGAQTSISSQQLKRMPTISRSQSDFTRLEPTASNGSFGGRNDQFNNFSLDGSIFNNPFGLDAATPGGQTNAQPISLDAIEQVSVSLAPYDVTLSGFTGASVNAVTKSGTNTWTGTTYGFFRNENLTGGRIKGDEVFKGDLGQTQYGVSVGGPIVKDKLFFFANFERDDLTELGSAFAPNRNTGAINESRVDANDLMAVQSALAALGYDTGAFEGFNYGAESTKGIIKFDWNVNDNNRVAFIYNFLRASKEKPAHPTALGFRGPSANTLQFQNSGYEINNNLDSWLLELNSTFDETTTNKLQIGYTRFDDFRNALSTPAPSILIEENGSNYIVAGHEPFSINNRLDQQVIQITNNMNFFKGDHTYTVGFSFEKFMFDNSFNLGVYGGTFGFPVGGGFRNFASVQEFLLNAQPGGLIDTMIQDAIATEAALSSRPEGEAGGFALAETNVGQMAFYVQDEWNITEDFKLTYGIRFDKPLYFDSAQNAQDVIDVSCCVAQDIPYVNPNTGETVFLDNRNMPTSEWLISPRVGFNWDVRGDQTFQVRGGSGVFTGRLPFVWLGNQIGNPNAFFLQMVDPDFKFPQVWRTNLGVDYKFESGYTWSTDVAYTKDINGAHVQNWGLTDPTGNLVGVDNREYYLPSDIINNAYVFTNSDKGRIINISTKIEKQWDNGWYTNLAYSYLDARDVNSIEAEITGDAFAFNPVVGNANRDILSRSRYGDTHRVIGLASKQFNWFGESAPTTFTTFFEYARGGRFNYTYGGDINGDGSVLNDLLYVPTLSEIGQMQFSGAGQADAFNEYIEQDDYLSGRRGRYVERYGALAPWRGRWDVRILQDIPVSEGGNTIQLSLDILNVGNLLSSQWGLVEQPRNLQPVGVSVDPNTLVPTYTFDPSLTDTFTVNADLLSRWQAQFGIRYIF